MFLRLHSWRMWVAKAGMLLCHCTAQCSPQAGTGRHRPGQTLPRGLASLAVCRSRKKHHSAPHSCRLPAEQHTGISHRNPGDAAAAIIEIYDHMAYMIMKPNRMCHFEVADTLRLP